MPELPEGWPGVLRRKAEAFLRHGVCAVVPDLLPLHQVGVEAAARLKPLPYHDMGFSGRVLRQQLDQSTDQSSRRLPLIDRQVSWLRHQLPPGSLRRVFHPMCGPGFFASALHRHGAESYLGVDVGPAVVAFAHRLTGGLPAFAFEEADVQRHCRSFAGEPFTACLLTYEALNAFPPPQARVLLRSAAHRLEPGGWLAMDVRLGRGPADGFGRKHCSYHADGSVFAEGPHLLLDESARIGPGAAVVGHRFLVVPAEPDAAVTTLHSLIWRYSSRELAWLLDASGFDLVAVQEPFTFDSDVGESAQPGFVLARRRPR